MPAFKEMDQDEVKKALDGHVDILSGAAAKEQALLAAASCPKCGSRALNTTLDVENPFSPGAITPNRVSTCTGCGARFNPLTGFVRSSRG